MKPVNTDQIFFLLQLIIVVVVQHPFKALSQNSFDSLLINRYNINIEKSDSFKVKEVSIIELINYSNFLPEKSIIKIAQDISKLQHKNGDGLILTYGTNGSCGREGMFYDSITTDYKFRYASINCSCTLGHVPLIAKWYNTIAYKYLDQKNEVGWINELENKIWIKYLTRNKNKLTSFDTNLFGRYKDELGNEIRLKQDSFEFKHVFDLSMYYAKGLWRVKNNIIYLYPFPKKNIDIKFQPFNWLELKPLIIKNRSLYKMNKDNSIQEKRINVTWSKQKKRNFYKKIDN